MEDKALRAFFGPPSRFGHPDFGVLALEQTDSQWVVMSNKEQKVMVKSNSAKVVGVMIDSRAGLEAGLLALEDNRQTVTLNTGKWQKEILHAHGPIKQITLCQRWPYIAYSTDDGEIVIYSIMHGVDLCRYLPETGE